MKHALAALFLLVPLAAEAAPQRGLAMHGAAALPDDFKHYPYANPDAPQGGALNQALTGSFDSVNPFIVKGQKAANISVYVFESLMSRNWAEPFALYCHICETIDVSDDRQSFTFKLRPDAAFSDGKPVTSADVVFSMNLLREKGLPRYKSQYAAVKTVETPDPLTVTFTQTDGNRELPLLVGLMPILPKHFWEGRDFEASTLEPLTGSGPYTMAAVKPGEKIAYKRDRNWWGKNLATGRGLWNFDEINIDYYKDGNATFEAFKSGLADIRVESDPVKWASGYDFPAVAEKKIALEKIASKTPAPANGFVFNTRRGVFKDKRVREALLHCFDFEWANANLFAGAFQRTHGYFSGSELSSRGRPASEGELRLLGGAAQAIDPALLDGGYSLPVTDGSGRDRKTLRKALNLLKEAGYSQDGGKLADAQGKPLAFSLAVQNKDQEKIALHFQRSVEQLGITMEIRLVDSAQFTRIASEFDYDMAPYSIFNSLSPGNEQKNFWLSPSRDAKGSRNLSGAADPAIDAAIDALVTAKERSELIDAARALDRLLINNVYMIPFYDAGGQWVARWTRIGRPDQQPLPGFETTTLWRAE